MGGLGSFYVFIVLHKNNITGESCESVLMGVNTDNQIVPMLYGLIDEAKKVEKYIQDVVKEYDVDIELREYMCMDITKRYPRYGGSV